ncbi:MAG: NAD(P)-dependent oxidoreductase [Hoeflea sp.]|uniref:NAD(P)-dependent oxidoreductase n=1 Tax=Hoeflea sp. TaxID=1940281 RepID=UPI0032ED193C
MPEKTAGAGAASSPIGWIGVGKMGLPMAGRLLGEGQTLIAIDKNEEALAQIAETGAAVATSIADFTPCRTVFTMVPDDAALDGVVFGENGSPGLLESIDTGNILVEMSTVSPGCSARVAEALVQKGIHYIRAPVSGSTALAQSGQLTVLGSGDEKAWEEVKPLLSTFSAKQFYFGDGDEARFMKLVLNTLVGATSAILAEALLLGEQGGLTRSQMMSAINDSAVASPLLKYKQEIVENDSFEPAFTVGQMIKDFTLVTQAGLGAGIPLLATSMILQQYQSAARMGMKDKDFFSLVKWLSEISGRTN